MFVQLCAAFCHLMSKVHFRTTTEKKFRKGQKSFVVNKELTYKCMMEKAFIVTFFHI